MTEYHSFSEEKVQEAISSAHSLCADEPIEETTLDDDGRLQTLVECLPLSISRCRVCFKHPFLPNDIRIPIPGCFDGKGAEVCLYVSTFYGQKKGFEIVVYVDGKIIARKKFRDLP